MDARTEKIPEKVHNGDMRIAPPYFFVYAWTCVFMKNCCALFSTESYMDELDILAMPDGLEKEFSIWSQ